MPSGPTQAGNHLFVIMTDICPQGFHLLFSVSSIRAGQFHDKSCLVTVGDHSFVRHPSYVVYRLAEKRPATTLVKCVDGWLFMPKEPVSDELYSRIRAGALESPFLPSWALGYLLANS